MKLLYKKNTQLTSLFWLILFANTIFIFNNGYGQDAYPREYTNPDEIVTFDKNTSFVDALEVINQFYQEYRNKFIVDLSGVNGVLGVNLPLMHWEDALGFILKINNLTILEYEKYVEIVNIEAIESEEDEALVEQNVGKEIIVLNTREIRINATFFEGNRRALQEIGVDWSTISGAAPQDINTAVKGDLKPENGVPQTTWDNQFVAINSFNASSVSQNVFNALVNLGSYGSGANKVSVQALFGVLEADNLGEVLATPFTKVLDKKEGRVQVGQDFSIKQKDIAGNVTDQFFSTGTILKVTPTVININDTSFIHLKIDVERSSAQPDAVSTVINKQVASTEALLLDGEPTAIAGLYRTEETKVRRGVPFLKDLPPWFFGLRYLFGFNSDDYVENELVIIVQASFVKSLKDRVSEGFASMRNTLESERIRIRKGIDEISDIEQEIDTSKEANEVENIEDLQINPETLDTNPNQKLLDTSISEESSILQTSNIETTNIDITYFVIAGSFVIKQNAQKLSKILLNKGYKTQVIFNPDTELYLVSYDGFPTRDLAVFYLTNTIKNLNSEAWLISLPVN